MRAILWILPLLLTALLKAQDAQPDSAVAETEPAAIEEVETPALESVSVPVEMVNQSWFTDRTGTAVIHFDEVVEAPESLPSGVRGLSFIDIEVRATPDSKWCRTAA